MVDIRNDVLATFESMPAMTSLPVPAGHRYLENKIKEFLTTKETRILSHENKSDIFGWSPSVMFPEYETFYQNIAADDLPREDYSNATDGYGFSELFVASRRYIVNADYLRYVKNTTNPMVVNVYGSENSLLSKRFWEFTDHAKERDDFINGNIPECKLDTPVIQKYTAFNEPTYLDEVYIDECQDALAVLAIDLPHKYYSTQILKGNIFTWDIGNQKYQIGGKDLNEINLLINQIAISGITEPLVMRINEGCLTPANNDDAIKLFLATYMNLPSIPVVLYMSDDEAVKNIGYEELHNVVHSNIWHSRQALEHINSICKPYFFFELKEDARNKTYLTVDGEHFAKSQYPTMQSIDDVTVDVFDHFLDTSAPVEEVHVPMSLEALKAKVLARDEELLKELHKKLEADAQEHIQKILNGDFD